MDEVDDLVDPEIKMEAAEGEGDQGLHTDDSYELKGSRKNLMEL